MIRFEMITFEDYLEIRNLVARYCLATDNADVDGFMACWVPAEDFAGYDSGAFGHMDTWDEMYAFEKHHVSEQGMARGKRHQATNVHIVPVSADEVRVTHDLLVVEVADAPMVIASGRYDDSVVVRTPAGWRFASRKLTVDPGYFALLEQWKAAGLVPDDGHG